MVVVVVVMVLVVLVKVLSMPCSTSRTLPPFWRTPRRLLVGGGGGAGENNCATLNFLQLFRTLPSLQKRCGGGEDDDDGGDGSDDEGIDEEDKATHAVPNSLHLLDREDVAVIVENAMKNSGWWWLWWWVVVVLIYTDGSVTRNRSGWGFTVKQGGRTVHEDSGAHRVTTSSLTMEVEAVTHAIQWLTSQRDAQIIHAIILTNSMNLLQKVESGMGCPDWHTVMHSLRLKDFCGFTVLCTPESVGMNGQIEWQAQQISHLDCNLAGQRCSEA